MLGEGTSKALLDTAAEQGIDLLVVFEVKVEQNRKTGFVINETRVAVFQVATRKEIRKGKELRNTEVQLKRADLKDDADDPVKVEIDKLFAPFFADAAPEGDQPDLRVKMSEIPQGMAPEHVKGRVESLLASASDKQLPTLAEIKFYHHRGLLDDETFAASFQKVLGEADGAKLAKGTEEERLAAVAGLLPKDPN
ncbi:MAG: hypothetical protein FJ276_13925 [Planctomycetes bacterium]|nr:hypothetical protein [Planctomycetota bacterium]